MAYHFDPYDNSIVVDGFEEGIADSPHQGISDMRNVNIVSIPGEASVAFSTSQISPPTGSGNVTSASAGNDTVTITGSSGIDSGSAVTFSGGSLPAGIVAGTVYWIVGSGGVFTVYTNYARTVVLDITGTGTGTWATVNMTAPKSFAYDSVFYWMVDSSGYVWSNKTPTVTNSYWTYTGNKINNRSNGNGLIYYQGSDGTGWLFVFSNSSVDYTGTATVSWQYQWNPATGVNGGYNINPTDVLKTPGSSNFSHRGMVGPDNKVYYPDWNYVGRWYQTAIGTPFVPTTLATYTFDQTSVLPFTDIANCLAPLGNNMLVGGSKNVIYPWDTFSNLPSYPIFISEYNIVDMVTVNTSTYILAGTRGRIYITNGSQAQLFKKIPDHISGTVEPYFTWGGLAANKNQLYFSFQATDNASAALSQYGGVWAIDLDSKALRLANKLSYGTYAGYATALIAIIGAPAGSGLYIGWNSNVSTYGIDKVNGTPYTGSEATIDSDLIPIGTYDKVREFTRLEYKLTKPMVSGESVTIKYRLIFNTSDTGYTTTLTDSTVGNYSLSGPINFKQAQWVQFQIVLNSTASSPSYTRLKQIRITGLVAPTQ